MIVMISTVFSCLLCFVYLTAAYLLASYRSQQYSAPAPTTFTFPSLARAGVGKIKSGAIVVSCDLSIFLFIVLLFCTISSSVHQGCLFILVKSTPHCRLPVCLPVCLCLSVCQVVVKTRGGFFETAHTVFTAHECAKTATVEPII